MRNEKNKHEGERRQHHDIAQRTAINRAPNAVSDMRPIWATACDGSAGDREHVNAERDQPGQGEADHHVVVHAEHVRAQALVDFGATGPCDALAPAGACVAVEVGHEFL